MSAITTLPPAVRFTVRPDDPDWSRYASPDDPADLPTDPSNEAEDAEDAGGAA